MFNHNKAKRIMDEKGILQWELADAAGVTEAAMSYILRGLREPSLMVAGHIAKRLDVTVDELLSDDYD